MNNEKYGRSLHSPISKGTTSDDRIMDAGYLEYFASLKNIVLTEKLDGQNGCFKKSGLYARSHAAPSKLPWDKPLIDRWSMMKNDLGSIEIFGENMYATHSIAYSKLESYFYVFAVRDKGQWLSWEEVKFWAAMFDFPTVPEIDITTSIGSIYTPGCNEDRVLEKWFRKNLGMSWEESTKTGGLLGGYDPLDYDVVSNDITMSPIYTPQSEGFVIRNADGFPCTSIEFSNLFKLVRESHVKTDVHWTKTWCPAGLIDCSKYNWYGYEYLMEK